MSGERREEIEQNYEAFQDLVCSLLPQHEGKYALMHSCDVIDVYEKLVDAVAAGLSEFEDGMFSIQEVTTQPLDLGFFSHANPHGRVLHQ